MTDFVDPNAVAFDFQFDRVKSDSRGVTFNDFVDHARLYPKPLNSEITTCIRTAVQRASKARVQWLTTERIFHALLELASVREVLSQIGCDIRVLADELAFALDDEDQGDGEIYLTRECFRILLRAICFLNCSRRTEVESRDVLVSIVKEPLSLAASILSRQHVNQMDVLNYITHGEQAVLGPHS